MLIRLDGHTLETAEFKIASQPLHRTLSRQHLHVAPVTAAQDDETPFERPVSSGSEAEPAREVRSMA